ERTDGQPWAFRIWRIQAVTIKVVRRALTPAEVAVRVELHVGRKVVLPVDQRVGIPERHHAGVEQRAVLWKAGPDIRLGTVGFILVAILETEPHPALVAERYAEVAGPTPRPAIARGILSDGRGDAAALRAFFQDHVDDARDRVGTVLGRCAVAQHFDVVDRGQ